MNTNKYPAFRLNSYVDAWQVRKIGEFLEESRVPGSDGLKAKKITVKLWGKGVIPKVESYSGSESTKYYKRSAGQFIYGKLDFLNQAFGIIPEHLEGYESTIDSPAFDISNLIDPNFLLEYVSRKEFYILQGNMANGSRKAKRIHSETFFEMSISIPDLKEQSEIGLFFKKIDNTITLHQQELDALKQTKQGFLQKMLPKEGESVPKVRFSKYSGQWEKEELGGLVNKIRSYPLSRDVETNSYSEYKYIHYGDIHKKVAKYIDDLSYLPNIQEGNYEWLEEGDLVLADASEDYQGIANAAILAIKPPKKVIAGLHTIALRPNSQKVNSLYLYYLLESSLFKKFGYKTGTGMKVFGISTTNLLKFSAVYPTLEEQSKIGEFFRKLDEVIELKQKEIETLKQTKKGFLQKMFV